MGWTSVNSDVLYNGGIQPFTTAGGSNQSKTWDYNTISTNGTVGNIIVCYVAKDNSTIVQGFDTNEVVSITDSKGNIYQNIRDLTRTNGVKGDGCYLSIWYTKITNELVLGDTVTVTFDSSTDVMNGGFFAEAFSMSSTENIVQSRVAGGTWDTTFDPSPLTLINLDNIEYLFLDVLASEGPGTDSFTHTSGWTTIRTNGTTGGADDSNITLTKTTQITTVTQGSLTADYTSLTADRDSVQLLVGLKEYPPNGKWFV